MTTSTVTPEIVEFAQGVRAALADLPPEEVDELTEGLEADLSEAYAEDLQRELPDPAAYATELRSAAGLPERSAQAGAFRGLVDGWNDTRRDLLIAIRRNPAMAAALEFVGVLRPLWWVVRAWLATWLLAAFFGMERGLWFDGASWIVLVAFVVISVQWGRGLWRAKGVSGLIVVGNVVAVVALLPALAAADTWSSDYDAPYVEEAVTQGLSMDGQPIENIYVYDANGKPLRNVQLFDVDGKPLEPVRDVELTQIEPQPALLETGVGVYNVYPLTLVRKIYDETGELVVDPSPDVDKVRAYEDGPFVKVPAVLDPEKVAKSNR